MDSSRPARKRPFVRRVIATQFSGSGSKRKRAFFSRQSPRPRGTGPFPALVILHGTHGFAEEYVQLARDIGRNGVLGVALCWFGGRKGIGVRFITPIECPDAPPRVDLEGSDRFRLARRSIDALLDTLRARPDVQTNSIALFGHSRGGGAALDYLLSRPGKVKAAILNSAGYPAELTERASAIKASILMLQLVPPTVLETGDQLSPTLR